LTASLLAHVSLAIFIAAVAHRASTTIAMSPRQFMPLTWTGMGGGGGASGDQHQAPPRQLERPRDRQGVAIVAAPRPTIGPSSSPKQPDVPPPAIADIDPVESGLRVSPGVSTAVAQPSDYLGPGSGENGGNGSKRGSGDDDGDGIGKGRREGIGGVDGSGGGPGDIAPVLLTQVRPNYTQAGIMARAQGVMRVEAVVLQDGTVGDVRIVRGFEPPFGLDQEALIAVKQWRFVPGRRQGRITPMRVSIELTFTLR